MENRSIKLIECPRDAMQGMSQFIPTDKKIEYLNALLKVGFDTLDFGSFVSPKAVPQMKDTAEVLEKLEPSATKLLAIVLNEKGATQAANFEQIAYLGYPFSISETFQQRNAKNSIQDSFNNLLMIKDLCEKKSKTVVAYLSMGFGNPYGDPWDIEIVESFTEKLVSAGINIISLADTDGSATPQDVFNIFNLLPTKYPNVEFGAHFHAAPNQWQDKLSAAFDAGCRRFDTALKGFGGCPFAKDELTGNIATEKVLLFLLKKYIEPNIHKLAFNQAMLLADKIFTISEHGTH